MSAKEEEVDLFAARTPRDEWRIGVILIRAGLLKQDDVLKIMRLQRKNGLRFGDVAIQLGVLREPDIRFALARQFDFSYLGRAETKISKDIVAAHDPDSAQAEDLRALRSQLVLRWLDGTEAIGSCLAVVGPDGGARRSWVAANLAVSFSHLGKKTVLVDADLRDPSQHSLFGLSNRQGLSEALFGRVAVADVMHRSDTLRNLAVIPAGTTPPNPQEVVARPELEQLLDSLRSASDVVIVDTPASNRCADGQIIAMRARAALLVTRRNVSSASTVRAYVEDLKAVNVKVVGSVFVE